MGAFAIKGRRILVIRELLSCNFWGISTILQKKVQGTSRENILRLFFFGKLRARVSCILYPTLVLEAPISMALGHWVSFYFNFFLIPPYFSPPLPPHLLLCPSHSLQPLPSPLLLHVLCPPLISPLVGWLPWSSLNREFDARLDNNPGS